MRPVTPENTCFALVSFEGPDAYSQVGGLGTRVRELGDSLAQRGFPTHHYFIGDPELPEKESRFDGGLTLRRWCRDLSRWHPAGAYDGEDAKVQDLTRTLPSALLDEVVAPAANDGRLTVVLAEEWQTAWAVLGTANLAHERGLENSLIQLWNANSTWGCQRLPWPQLSTACTVSTVSRFMKQQLWAFGANPVVIPNGIPERLLRPPPAETAALRDLFRNRLLLVKVARFDPTKRWLQAVQAVAGLKREGAPVVLVMRGANEPYGREVLWTAWASGLKVADIDLPDRPTARELVNALGEHRDADVLNVTHFLGEAPLRMLYRAADAVLANSGFEPFGLVGLEAMAENGMAFTGATGEDYARSFENAVCIETDDPREIAASLAQLQANPALGRRIRREARRTAERYVWSAVVELLCRRVENIAYCRGITPGKGRYP